LLKVVYNLIIFNQTLIKLVNIIITTINVIIIKKDSPKTTQFTLVKN